MHYSAATRRETVERNLFSRYRWDRELWDKLPPDSTSVTQAKGPKGWSLRRISEDVAQFYGTKPVSPQTISKDILDIFRGQHEKVEAKLDELLQPENFPEWRATFFQDPATGKPYETPEHQYHWFRLVVAVALKEAIPPDTLSYLLLPEDLNDKLLGGEHLLSLILLAPPRHGKTELLIHACIWLICRNPKVRIIYCSGISNTSKDNLRLVRNELTSNEELILRYGPFKDDDAKWNEDLIEVKGRSPHAKAPTMRAVGLQSNVRSFDADLIVLDDPQDLDRATSETTTDRDFKWTTGELMTRREPHTGFVGIGSHLPTMFGDLWSRIEETAEDMSTGRHKIVISKTKAHDYEKCDPVNDPEHVNCVLWHSLRPYPFLESLRAVMADDALFESVYNQELIEDVLQYFRKEVIRGDFIYPEPEKGKLPDLNIAALGEKGITPGILDRTRSWKSIPECCGKQVLAALGVDPAAGETRYATESAFSLRGGCPICERRYAIDYHHIRQSPEQNPHTILGFLESYGKGNIMRVRIEKNAYQKALARDPLLVNAQAKWRFVLEAWETDARKNDPMMGIPILSRSMELGKYSVPYATHQDQQMAEYLLKQYIRWPRRPNDVVHSEWLADLSVEQMIEESRYAVPEYGDDWETMPGHLREQVHEIDMGEVIADPVEYW